MNRNRTKLYLSIDTLRHLRTADLAHARGGGSQGHTCSLCPGLTGCDTGERCLGAEPIGTKNPNHCPWPPPLS